MHAWVLENRNNSSALGKFGIISNRRNYDSFLVRFHIPFPVYVILWNPQNHRTHVEVFFSKTMSHTTSCILCVFQAQVEKVRKAYPGNRMAKYFNADYFNSQTEANKEVLYRCVKTGIDNPDSSLGCYAMKVCNGAIVFQQFLTLAYLFLVLGKRGKKAMSRLPPPFYNQYLQPSDYETFSFFFDKVIRDYHGDASGKKIHETDWDISAIGDKGVLDVTKLGLPELSMRVRVGECCLRVTQPMLRIFRCLCCMEPLRPSHGLYATA